MRNKKEERRVKEFESQALVDIVTNIFIFFFITTSLLYTFNPSKVNVTLPRIPRDEEVQMPIEITIDSVGDIYLRYDKLSEDQLTEKLKEESSYKPIVLRGDKTLQYGKVDKVLDAIFRADPSRKVNLAIIVEE
jgi:biopolymer transport protein ExbD